MKKILIPVFSFIIIFSLVYSLKLKAQIANPEYIIYKENGRIILAYKVFEDFLNSDMSWNSYVRIVLNSYPEMQEVHKKILSWGSIDPAKFPKEVTAYKKADYIKFMDQYDNKTFNYLYDSLIQKANEVLRPVKTNPVDLCFFLPYGGCFIQPGEKKSTIYISMLIDPADVPKIMIHEYAHNLHIQRRPEEPFNLRREIVSEGMAVYLTTLVMKDPGLSKSIPFMSETSVKWCFENEQDIKNSIKTELSDSTFNCLKKFIADGSISAPPAGFVEKTGYFAGYRIIDACIKKGIKLEELCSLNSEAVIRLSGYFE